MGRRGPKPLPAGLRVLRGGSRVRRPAVIGNPPTLPDGLSDAEQVCWRGLLAELQSVPGLVQLADRGICELIARLEPQMRAAAIVVREQGSTLTVCDKDGAVRYVQTRPEAGFVLKTAGLLKSLYAELGLSPSGRCRVALTPAAPTSKLDRFLQDHRGA